MRPISLHSFPLFPMVVLPALLVGTVLTCVIILGYYFILAAQRNGPPVMAGLPVIGCLLDFARGPLEVVKKGYKQHGECFTVMVLGQRLTFLIGPGPQDAFFRATDAQARQREVYKFTVPVFGKDVVYDCEPEVTAQQLRFMSPGLSSVRLKSYVGWFVKETEDYVEKWGDAGVVDLRNALSELTILTASRCLLGKEIREEMFDRVSSLYHDLDEGMLPISFFFPNLPIKKHRIRNAARDEMQGLFTKVLVKRRAEGATSEKYQDLLQTLMEAHYKDGRHLSDHEICGMLLAALFAGQHTSSITSTWTGLLMVNEGPRFLEQVLEEQRRVLTESEGQLNFDSLQKMDLLHRCVKEALRMYPPLILLMRKIFKEITYKEITVRPGDIALVSPAFAHRLPGVFKDPNTFDPSRFAPPREEDRAAPFSFIGFGGGRHGCMGENFAYLQIKSIWTVLLNNFEFELLGPVPPPNYDALVVGPDQQNGRCMIRYKRRSTGFLKQQQ